MPTDTTEDRCHPWTMGNRLLGYDPRLRRVWVGGQRLHHGATGMALAGITLVRLAAGRRPARRGLSGHQPPHLRSAQAPRRLMGGARGRDLMAMLAGSAMVAHDWKDRAVWFQRGPQPD